MKIEEKIKNNFLYSKNLNLFKLLYFFFQYIKSKLYPILISILILISFITLFLKLKKNITDDNVMENIDSNSIT